MMHCVGTKQFAHFR